MTGVLRFNLPDELEEFETAQKGVLYKIALSELDQWLRGKVKYDDLPIEHQELLQSVRDELRRIAIDNGLEV